MSVSKQKIINDDIFLIVLVLGANQIRLKMPRKNIVALKCQMLRGRNHREDYRNELKTTRPWKTYKTAHKPLEIA